MARTTRVSLPTDLCDEFYAKFKVSDTDTITEVVTSALRSLSMGGSVPSPPPPESGPTPVEAALGDSVELVDARLATALTMLSEIDTKLDSLRKLTESQGAGASFDRLSLLEVTSATFFRVVGMLPDSEIQKVLDSLGVVKISTPAPPPE